MEGNLAKVDFRSILESLNFTQQTGILGVETFGYEYYFQKKGESLLEEISFIFFVEGKIAYAFKNNDNLQRLQNYLNHHNPMINLPEILTKEKKHQDLFEYWLLCFLKEKGILNGDQVEKIITNFIEEIIFDLLPIKQGYFIFEKNFLIKPLITCKEVFPLVSKIMKQLQVWKQFYPSIIHPYQCPVITDEVNLRAALSTNAYDFLYRWSDGKTNLRQLSRYLDRDLITIAKAIFPCLERGWVHLLNPETINSSQEKVPSQVSRFSFQSTTLPPHLFCITNETQMIIEIETALKQIGYQLTISRDTIEALSLAFKIKPQAIVIESKMANLDGYGMCKMLRQAKIFREIPIIMLIEDDFFEEEIKTKIYGATHYLRKPLQIKELLRLLEKYFETSIFANDKQ